MDRRHVELADQLSITHLFYHYQISLNYASLDCNRDMHFDYLFGGSLITRHLLVQGVFFR